MGELVIFMGELVISIHELLDLKIKCLAKFAQISNVCKFCCNFFLVFAKMF